MLISGAATASAATYTVNPTQLYLSAKHTSTLLTLRNGSEQPLRFQLSVFAWNQSESGDIELSPTSDIVFFPALLTLRPGEERKVRIGAVARPGQSERTYRIFVEELADPQGAEDGAAVRVLTKMGVPVFLRPEKERAQASLDGLVLRGDTLSFAISNSGTVHFVPQSIRLEGVAATGESLFRQEVAGWYILAGGRRHFTVTLPRESCARLTSVLVAMEIGTTGLKEHLQTPAGACQR
jgi:fimbrial chaperone protein